MTTIEDRLVYRAEQHAFEGTPLFDNQDRRSLMAETAEIVTNPWVVPFVGRVVIKESSVTMVNAAAYARAQTIAFAPNTMGRYVAVHEIAHVVHRRSHAGGTAHGPQYRALYAELVSVVYGPSYGQLLREAFHEENLPVGPALLHMPERPIIDIDRLADASLTVRWLT